MDANNSFKYKAFMSYSHAADGKLAPALQSALHQFAKPWYRLRAMRVFRDKTSLAMTPELWPTIQEALAESEYFLLLASPQAAQSPWVQKEVDGWLQHRRAQTLFIVLTEGEAVWDETTGDFNWSNTNALPAVFEAKFKHEPLYVDLRWAKTVENLSLRHSQFRPAALDISSTLLGRPKDELDGEDVQQHRRLQTITRIVGVVLTLLALLVTIGIVGVILQTREVSRQTSLVLATVAQNASDKGHYDTALRFAILAADDTWLSPASIEAYPQIILAAHASGMQVQFQHADTVRSATFSPNGTRVVTAATDKTARVWEVATGNELAQLTHEDPVRSASFSPDGTRVVTAAHDTVRVWEVKELARFTHEGFVESATFSPNGTRIITSSSSYKTARIWKVATGKELARLTHGRFVRSATFSPDGTRVVTASHDKTAPIWDVHWLTQYHGQELIKRVCQEKLLGARHITRRDIELSQILSGREGEDVCDPPSWFSRITKSLGFGR